MLFVRDERALLLLPDREKLALNFLEFSRHAVDLRNILAARMMNFRLGYPLKLVNDFLQEHPQILRSDYQIKC